MAQKTPQKKLETNEKYLKQFDEIKVRVPKGCKDKIQDLAGEQGVNAFIIGLINEKLEKMNCDTIPVGVKAIKKKETSEQ